MIDEKKLYEEIRQMKFASATSHLKVLNKIKEQPLLMPDEIKAMQWISVNDRLPDEPEPWTCPSYNVAVKMGNKLKAITCDWEKAKVRGKDVLRWMYRDWETDRKSTRLNSSHSGESRMPSSA